jgi:hypothetical protein
MCEVADGYVAENHGAGADVDTATEYGRFGKMFDVPNTECAVLPNDAVIADNRRTMDDDAGLVLDDHPSAHGGRIGKLDAVVIPDTPIEMPIEDAQWRPHDLRLDTHSPTTEPVNSKRPESRPGPITTVHLEVLTNEAKKGWAC